LGLSDYTPPKKAEMLKWRCALQGVKSPDISADTQPKG